VASDVHSSLKKVDAELCLCVGSGASKVFYGLISNVDIDTVGDVAPPDGGGGWYSRAPHELWPFWS
jgi:hypothetical protein